MKHFADIALPPVLNDELKFYPAKYKNTYKNWLENIQDWCISRQLWWGHRIPAYYYNENDDYVVAETREEALKLAQQKDPKITDADLRQDEDALDTWFSSWLWPISLFDGRMPSTHGSLHGSGLSLCSMVSIIQATRRSSTTTPLPTW